MTAGTVAAAAAVATEGGITEGMEAGVDTIITTGTVAGIITTVAEVGGVAVMVGGSIRAAAMREMAMETAFLIQVGACVKVGGGGGWTSVRGTMDWKLWYQTRLLCVVGRKEGESVDPLIVAHSSQNRVLHADVLFVSLACVL